MANLLCLTSGLPILCNTRPHRKKFQLGRINMRRFRPGAGGLTAGFARIMSSQPPAAALIPVIHTERLILRAHTPNDFLISAALWAGSHVTHFIGGARA